MCMNVDATAAIVRNYYYTHYNTTHMDSAWLSIHAILIPTH